MGILDADEIEVLLPEGAFLVERHVAETDLDPFHPAIVNNARVAHAAQVFNARDRARAERAGLDRAQEGLVLARLDAGGDEIAHRVLPWGMTHCMRASSL